MAKSSSSQGGVTKAASNLCPGAQWVPGSPGGAVFDTDTYGRGTRAGMLGAFTAVKQELANQVGLAGNTHFWQVDVQLIQSRVSALWTDIGCDRGHPCRRNLAGHRGHAQIDWNRHAFPVSTC